MLSPTVNIGSVNDVGRAQLKPIPSSRRCGQVPAAGSSAFWGGSGWGVWVMVSPGRRRAGAPRRQTRGHATGGEAEVGRGGRAWRHGAPHGWDGVGVHGLSGPDGGADQAQQVLAGGAGVGGGLQGVGGLVADLQPQGHGDLADEDPGRSFSCGQSYSHVWVAGPAAARWGGPFRTGHWWCSFYGSVGRFGRRLPAVPAEAAGGAATGAIRRSRCSTARSCMAVVASRVG